MLGGCGSRCDRRGDVRCVGDSVEICGYEPGDEPAWNPAAECAPFGAQCSTAEPGLPGVRYCAFSDFVCDDGPMLTCHAGHVVRCVKKGAPARLERPCKDGCSTTRDPPVCTHPGERDDGGPL